MTSFPRHSRASAAAGFRRRDALVGLCALFGLAGAGCEGKAETAFRARRVRLGPSAPAVPEARAFTVPGKLPPSPALLDLITRLEAALAQGHIRFVESRDEADLKQRLSWTFARPKLPDKVAKILSHTGTVAAHLAQLPACPTGPSGALPAKRRFVLYRAARTAVHYAIWQGWLGRRDVAAQGLAASARLACHLVRVTDWLVVVMGLAIAESALRMAVKVGVAQVGCPGVHALASRAAALRVSSATLMGYALAPVVDRAAVIDLVVGRLAPPDRDEPGVRAAAGALYARYTHHVARLWDRLEAERRRGPAADWKPLTAKLHADWTRLQRSVGLRSPLDMHLPLDMFLDPNFRGVYAEILALELAGWGLAQSLQRLAQAQRELLAAREAAARAGACPAR